MGRRNCSIAVVTGVAMVMMIIMMTDIAESKIVCPDDASQAGSQDIGIKFNDTVPPVVRFWVTRLICNKRKKLALLHPASPATGDVAIDAVRPRPIQYPWKGDVRAMTPAETTTTTTTTTPRPSPGKAIKQFLLNHLLTRKRRDAYRFSYGHDIDDSDEDDSDDSDDSDDDDRRRGSRGYRHIGYRRPQPSYGYPTVYRPVGWRMGSRLSLNNRRRYGPLGVRYGNTRYGYRQERGDDDDDDGWAFRNLGPNRRRDDDEVEYQHGYEHRGYGNSPDVNSPYRFEGTNGYHGSYDNDYGYGHRGSLGYGARRYGYSEPGMGGRRSRNQMSGPF